MKQEKKWCGCGDKSRLWKRAINARVSLFLYLYIKIFLKMEEQIDILFHNYIIKLRNKISKRLKKDGEGDEIARTLNNRTTK
jgi:hypothetical protein